MVPELGEDRGQLDAHAVPPFVAVPSAAGDAAVASAGCSSGSLAGLSVDRPCCRRSRRPARRQAGGVVVGVGCDLTVAPFRLGARGAPATPVGQPQADQGRFARADALVGPAVVEPGEDPRDLLEGGHAVGAAGRPDPLAGAQVVDELLGRRDRLVVEELPVGHDDRGVVAGGVALDAFEGDLAVGRGLVVPDAEVVADGVPDRVAAHDRAERVGADADGVLAVGVALVLRVERRDPADLGGLEVELLRAERDAAAGDVAVDALHEMQQRQQRRPRLRVASDDGVGVRVQLGEDVLGVGGLALRAHPEMAGGVGASGREVAGHQRSTPPMTGSIEATATMTSATWPPSHIAATAWRLLNDGSRKCAR